MTRKDLQNMVLLYESNNSNLYLVEWLDGNKIHSLKIPASVAEYNTPSRSYNFQRFSKSEDRKFTTELYDDSDIKYLRSEENGDVWLNNAGDLPKLLNTIVTFGMSFNDLKDYFPKMTEFDYRWLQSLG